MPKRPKPREIVVGRSYLYRGRPVNLIEQLPDGVVCCYLDDDNATTFLLRFHEFGGLGEEVTDAG